MRIFRAFWTKPRFCVWNHRPCQRYTGVWRNSYCFCMMLFKWDLSTKNISFPLPGMTISPKNVWQHEWALKDYSPAWIIPVIFSFCCFVVYDLFLPGQNVCMHCYLPQRGRHAYINLKRQRGIFWMTRSSSGFLLLSNHSAVVINCWPQIDCQRARGNGFSKKRRNTQQIENIHDKPFSNWQENNSATILTWQNMVGCINTFLFPLFFCPNKK